MKKIRIQEFISPIMTRVFTYVIVGLTFALLWDTIVGKNLIDGIPYCSAIIGGLFLARTWFVFLRLDGVGIPRLPNLRKNNRRHYRGDIGSAVYTQEENNEELTVHDRDICAMLASVLTAAIFFLISVIA